MRDGVVENSPVSRQCGINQDHAGYRRDNVFVEDIQPSRTTDPAELAIKKHQRDQADPEHRHGIADQGHNTSDLVDPCAAFYRCQNSKWHTDGDADDGAKGGQLHRSGEHAFDVIDYRKTGAERLAKITLGDIDDVIEKLNDQWFVQTKGYVSGVAHLLAGTLANDRKNRINGHNPSDEKCNKQKAEHRDRNRSNSFDSFDTDSVKGRLAPPFYYIRGKCHLFCHRPVGNSCDRAAKA